MKAEGAKAVAWATMSAKDTSFMLTIATYFKEKSFYEFRLKLGENILKWIEKTEYKKIKESSVVLIELIDLKKNDYILTNE